MDTVKHEKKLRFLNLISSLYAQNLRFDKDKAVKYVSDRRITDSLVDTFRIGFASGEKNCQEWSYLTQYKDMSLELGLLYKDKNTGVIKPYFRNRIMFPFFDLQGNVIGFTGRDISGLSKAKYLNSPESDIFQKSIALYGMYQSHERIFRRRQVFLVEGNIDVLRMFEHDYPVVGLSSHDMSEHQAKILMSCYPEIFLVLDGDQAGKKGAIRVTQVFRELFKKGKKLRLPRLIELPEGYDPDRFFLEYSEPEDFINEQIWNPKFAGFPPRPKPVSSFHKQQIANSSDPEVIKQMNDIVDVISSKIELRQSGANYVARCPFHEERTASFVVSKSKQIYKCFGCGETGDVFSFIMKYDHVGFAQALKILGGR